MPHIPMGRFYRYRRSSIDEWLRTRERK
ncbi:hypothetical protein [Conexibacter sp. SYSU D00693]